jgi:transcription termination factor Rho
MSIVLDRESLAESPLADLHLLANELGVDGFRRLRKPDLIDAILARQADAPAEDEAGVEAVGDDPDAADAPAMVEGAAETEPAAPRRRRRSARADAVAEPAEPAEVEDEEPEDGATDEDAPSRPRRGRRGGRGRGRDRDPGADLADEPVGEEPGERTVEGVVELLGNGSAFVRLTAPDPTDDDVYISAAQVKRCELVSGDRVAGPVRAPRRSERHPSLIRVDTINGRPAEEVAEGTRFEDLPVVWPGERFALDADDVTLKAVEWLTPFGKGSRVIVAGPPRAGKTELARGLARALAGRDGLELLVALAGVRPEEVGDWSDEGAAPVTALTFAASPDAQAQAVEQVVEQGRRVAARGGDAVVVIDTLEYLPPQAARRALAAARNIPDGGSLTIVATAAAMLGGETTVITLDAQLTALRRFPALDLAASGTLRPELLVGDAGGQAIAKARADAAAD